MESFTKTIMYRERILLSYSLLHFGYAMNKAHHYRKWTTKIDLLAYCWPLKFLNNGVCASSSR